MVSELLHGNQCLLPVILILLLTFTPSSKYLQPAKKVNAAVLHPKDADADGMANSEDPDQTSLVWVCTKCADLSVSALRI